MSRAPADPEGVFPVASWLFRRLAAAPSGTLTAAVVGPTGWTAPAFEALRARVKTEDARMVVTHRPWSRPGGLSALGRTALAHHSPVVLGLLDRDGVATLVARRGNCQPVDALVALVLEQSGGTPLFAGMVTQALLDTGRPDPATPSGSRAGRVSVSPGLAARLRYLIEAPDPPVHDFLEALALEAPLDADILAALPDADPAGLSDTVEQENAEDEPVAPTLSESWKSAGSSSRVDPQADRRPPVHLRQDRRAPRGTHEDPARRTAGTSCSAA